MHRTFQVIIKINNKTFCEITSFVLTEYRHLQNFDIDVLVMNPASSLMCPRIRTWREETYKIQDTRSKLYLTSVYM